MRETREAGPFQNEVFIDGQRHLADEPAAVGGGGTGPDPYAYVSAGLGACTLRRQYRCHPDLAELSNTLFYGNALLNGCNAADRPPLLGSLAPLLFYDVHPYGCEMRDQRSYFNPIEATTVVRFVRATVSRGIEPKCIGVICLYVKQSMDSPPLMM